MKSVSVKIPDEQTGVAVAPRGPQSEYVLKKW
jgi:hypothetical protein